MRFRTVLAAALAAAPLLASPVWAGPFRDYETALRQVYGQYRVALFATNANKGQEAAKAIAAFQTGWGALAAQPVPPQYADDPGYAGTLSEVSALARTAEGEIAAGKLGPAHETLEKIRDTIGSLHQRNGVTGYSDRMNAYHEVMEQVLGMAGKLNEPGALNRLRGEVAVLAHLAGPLADAPAEAKGSEAFAGLVKALKESVSAVQGALDSGDVEAVKKALSGLKAPYAKLFLQFG